MPSTTPGQLVGNMLWLVPRYVEKHDTLMKLGSILTDPEDLESSLNLDAIPAIPPSARRDATAHVRHHVRSEISNSNDLFAKAMSTLPLFSAGASAGASADWRWSHSADTMVDAIDVKAEVFIPDKKFMEEAMKHNAVIEYIRKWSFSKSLYIIVGVATAGEISIKEKQNRQHEAGSSIHLTAPGNLGEIEGGFKHEGGTSKESDLSFVKTCDFAYRIRKFVYTRIRGLKDKGNYGRSAMFGREDALKTPSTVKSEVEELPRFLFLGQEDVAVPACFGLAVSDEAPI
ncbi:hypothetical protein ACHAQJ_002737 [Trichoderma viride]